jgi:hypothetical protein
MPMAGSAGAKGTFRRARVLRRDRAAGPFAESTRQPRLARPRPRKALITSNMAASKVAATALLTAIEMLEDHPLLSIGKNVSLALLTPFNSTEPGPIKDEVERRLADGFRTFKIKVGKSIEEDVRRVKLIQQAIGGRATMRLDANRAYSEADACRFASSLDPSGIELFEQPCPAEDWDANAKVASVSPVPVMLDEPICDLNDVKRASHIPNVGCWGTVFQASSVAGWRHASQVAPFATPANSMDSLSRKFGCSRSRFDLRRETLR